MTRFITSYLVFKVKFKSMKKITTTALSIFALVFFSVYALTFVYYGSFEGEGNEGTEHLTAPVKPYTLFASSSNKNVSVNTDLGLSAQNKTDKAKKNTLTLKRINAPAIANKASNTKSATNPTKVVIKQPNINLVQIMKSVKLPSASSGISLLEVARHNTPQSCYLAINGNVYNVSPYLNYHPAGPGIIIENCGKEVTGLFASIHSNRAWDLLADYKIGRLAKTNATDTKKLNARRLQIALSELAKALKKANPDLYVVNIKPAPSGFLAKVKYQNSFYELHIDKYGKITSQESEQLEKNWLSWSSDLDDRF